MQVEVSHSDHLLAKSSTYNFGNQSALAGLTLGGLRFIIYVCIYLPSVPKTQRTHEWDVELFSGLIFGATWTLFKAGAVPGAPGARRGPQGAENRPKTRGRIYHFILPKVFPASRTRNP